MQADIRAGGEGLNCVFFATGNLLYCDIDALSRFFMKKARVHEFNLCERTRRTAALCRCGKRSQCFSCGTAFCAATSARKQYGQKQRLAVSSV
jgi:hypothetical protein